MSRKPQFDISIFKKRRDRIAKKMQGSALVLFANPEFLRNYDSNYEYRQDSNFFYMTGFEEPESVFVFRPGKNPESVLFVRPKDAFRETWDGFRYGKEDTKNHFLMDEVFLISELNEKLPLLLKDMDSVLYRLNHHEQHDKVFLKALEEARVANGRSGKGILPVYDSVDFLGEFRLIKDETEIEWQKRACAISAIAHLETMKFIKPTMNERQVEAYIQYQFKSQMSARQGYNAIVASGDNATTLHYIFNDQECKDGDIILIDAGTEYNYYTGDITRSYPVNGTFTKIQKEFYNLILNAQEEVIKMVEPGIEHASLQRATVELLTDALIDLKLLKGKREELIAKEAYKKYYMHGVSHWLGIDVHDMGRYQVRGESRKLQPGMVFTIEPGLYVRADDDSAPKELRGLGVRIEDNILVTKNGYENLTALAPKHVDKIEEVMQSYE